MRKIILYKWESVIDFGQHKGMLLKEVFVKNPSYLNWCFQKIEWFCITDEIFKNLTVVTALKKENKIDNVIIQKDWLKILSDIHSLKKQELDKITDCHNLDEYNDDFEYHENEPFSIGDPRFDRNTNPWIDVFGDGEEAEIAYWNTE